MRKRLSGSGSRLLIFVFVIGTVCLSACNQKEEKQEVSKKKTKSALTFIRNDDCLNCHNIEDKSVGPTYVQISQRYEADFSTISKLANKIIEGGGGIWGSQQMSKHPFLEKKNAKKIVRWILSLSDSTVNKDPLLHTPGLKLSEVFQNKPAAAREANGLKLSIYPSDGLEAHYVNASTDKTSPVSPLHNGLANVIHFTGQEAFEPLQERVLLRASGSIHISEKGKYFFKLIKSGEGRVFMNGDKIINENKDDHEIAVDLKAGTYPIVVEYLLKPKDNTLSLQWITPDDEYYSVVPEEVFSVKN
ncbi:cytochrome c551/c552 [Catalinimonas alkaloidigena]|uniref:PA14 domain-containing protein n=1 Tax=Catalinimonas alkaloidigena TaxID=1075417 RepID=UPI002404E42E|nr:PA14 domain-containing protein [Catalinimonas alkaloidigena]MDF9801351.1 cytochrome c551/c552 [Catalinimonas alkaloidigena]